MGSRCGFKQSCIVVFISGMAELVMLMRVVKRGWPLPLDAFAAGAGGGDGTGGRAAVRTSGGGVAHGVGVYGWFGDPAASGLGAAVYGAAGSKCDGCGLATPPESWPVEGLN